MALTDTYITITRATQPVTYKDKGSKFIGFAFPLNQELEVRNYLDMLKKDHKSAVHFCYAWQLGTDVISKRANDDGEPAHSAGLPILGQIQHHRLTNILVVVVRYFGGVKLGVGGLMGAYKQAAQMAISSAEQVVKNIEQHFRIAFDYKDMDSVMRLLRLCDGNIRHQQMEVTCVFHVGVPKGKLLVFKKQLETLPNFTVSTFD
jgi:uncharacterized YigZ family protein